MGDDARRLTASRQNTGSNTATAVSPIYDHRYIVVAQGIEFRNGDVAMLDTHIGDSVTARGAAVTVISSSEFEYISHPQRVHFHCKVVWRKDEFITALKSPEKHVIYGGHARYGRGPCFGPYAEKSEDWQNSTTANSSKRGIFRMGYPYIGIQPHEIVDHGYTPTLCHTASRPAAADCHPEARAYRGSFRQFTALELDSTGDIAAKLSSSPGTQYWGYTAKRKLHVLHDAGWENTVVSPADLGGTDLQCRVFCHFGCSTYLHNYKIMRKPEFKGWRHEGNERYCYWTTAPAYALTPSIWLYHLFMYNRRSDFRSWAPSLAYAVQRTNRTLRNEGFSYEVI